MKIKVNAGTPYEMDRGDNPTFDQWMRAVDSVVWAAVGMSVYDLPDCDFRAWYDERLRPVRAAAQAVAAA